VRPSASSVWYPASGSAFVGRTQGAPIERAVIADGCTRPGRPSLRYLRRVGRAARGVAVAVAAGALAACGSNGAPPPAHGPTSRAWVDGAGRLVESLDSDVLLSANGGANLATARRAIADHSDVYSMLVAYDLFGDCGAAVAQLGSPGAGAAPVEQTLIGACRRLQHAATLFQRAMTRNDPRTLLAATRLVLDTAPLLDRAKTQLAALRAR
jgi:hypothetical protein